MSENKILKIEKIEDRRDTLGRRIGNRKHLSDFELEKRYATGRYSQKTEKDVIIARFKKIHGNKYDYSKFEYKGANRTNGIVICKKHGEFIVTYKGHMKGKGCPECKREDFYKNNILPQFKKVHGNKYDYSKVKYEYRNKPVIIICKKHGEFLKTPTGHIAGSGCLICARETNSKISFTNIKKSKIQVNNV